MRVVLVLAAIAIVLVAAGAVLEPLLSGGPRGREQGRAAPPEGGPFASVDRHAASDSSRASAIAELGRRLRVDDMVPGRPSRTTPVDGRAVARRMLRETCGGSDRHDECREAVASAAIRRVWAGTPRGADQDGKAERLLLLGEQLSLTPLQVTNSIRAELDEQLTRAVGSGAIGWRRRNAAITCFETPADCRLATGP